MLRFTEVTVLMNQQRFANAPQMLEIHCNIRVTLNLMLHKRLESAGTLNLMLFPGSSFLEH